MTSREKDLGLAILAEQGNVAQVISFSPDLELRHVRVHGFRPD
jgi:hypothetical protein